LEKQDVLQLHVRPRQDAVAKQITVVKDMTLSFFFGAFHLFCVSTALYYGLMSHAHKMASRRNLSSADSLALSGSSFLSSLLSQYVFQLTRSWSKITISKQFPLPLMKIQKYCASCVSAELKNKYIYWWLVCMRCAGGPCEVLCPSYLPVTSNYSGAWKMTFSLTNPLRSCIWHAWPTLQQH